MHVPLVAEKLAALELREPREREEGNSKGSGGSVQLTKDQIKAQKAQAKLTKDVADETAAVNAELALAVRAAAALKLDGQAPLSSVECGPFALPNPGGGPNLLEVYC
jgi:hypothetical protein